MNKRLHWIDIAKGIAILSVVLGHVKLIPWEPYRKIIFSFHMPLFFIVGGYTTKEDFSWNMVKKQAIRLLGPYLIACILVGFVRILQGSDLNTEIIRTLWGSGVPAHYGPGIPITGAESIPAAGAIWFLPCMFFSKVLFSMFLSAAKSCKEWTKAFLFLIICIFGYIIGQKYKIPLCIDVALFNVIFFYAGYLFRKNNGIALKSATVGALLFCLWYISLKFNALELSARFYRDFPMCIFTIAGAIAASFLIFYISEEVIDRINGIRAFLIWCGKYSLNILLIHHFDGFLFSYSWITSWLPDISSLSPLKQGCIISLYKIMIYVILCALYIQCKNIVYKWIKTRRFSIGSCHEKQSN